MKLRAMYYIISISVQQIFILKSWEKSLKLILLNVSPHINQD